MRRVLLCLICLLFCFGCKGKKETLPKQKVDIIFDLPKSSLSWERKPMSLLNKNPEFYNVIGITYAYTKDNGERYEAEVKNGEFVDIRFTFDDFSMEISNISTGVHLFVSIYDTDIAQSLKSAFLTGGLFYLLDELKNYELYYEQRGKDFYYKYNSLTDK